MGIFVYSIIKYHKILENKLKSFSNKDNIDAYVKLINETCSEIQRTSESSSGADLAEYGYWILPSGKALKVDAFQGHLTIANIYNPNYLKNPSIVDDYWVRVITHEEFTADFATINDKQFSTLMKILKDNDSYFVYERYSTDGEVFTNKNDFVKEVRSHVKATNEPKTMNPIHESVSNISALKTRNDLIKLARKFTDSSNVFAPSNFESYEDQDDMILKVSIFDVDKDKLQSIREEISNVLSEQGWKKNGDLYLKDSVRLKFYEVKKVFRSGAYQNRETPHLGIAIKGPKKTLI